MILHLRPRLLSGAVDALVSRIAPRKPEASGPGASTAGLSNPQRGAVQLAPVPAEPQPGPHQSPVQPGRSGAPQAHFHAAAKALVRVKLAPGALGLLGIAGDNAAVAR